MIVTKLSLNRLLIGAIALLGVTTAGATGSTESGSTKSLFCAACHGLDGNATYASARLAGQSTARFQASLKDYKEGKRLHPVMNILSLGLNEQDVQDLAMFYAAQKPHDTKSASLYWRLGGQDAINAAVDELLKLTKTDDRLSGRTLGACAPKLREQLCEATGGPCTYTGRDMATAHTGLKITEAEFGAVADNLVKVLDALEVPEQEKNELVALIAPLSKDIVGK